MDQEVPCEYQYDHNTYRCIVKSVDIRHITRFTNFVGEHYHGLSNNEVNMVAFKKSPMSVFPRGLTKIFPNFTVFEIWDCGLKEICKEDLRGFENCVFFSVIVNELTYLPGDLFEYAPKIQFIDFSVNLIRAVGPTIFEPLTNCIEFALRENPTFDDWYFEDYDLKKSAKRYKEFQKLVRAELRPMESLKEIATFKVAEGLNKDNALCICVCSHRMGLEGLKRKAFAFMKKNMVPFLDEALMNQPEKLLQKMKDLEGVFIIFKRDSVE
jgi:hypothetical protein